MVLKNKKFQKHLWISGVEYSLYDFTNDKGQHIFGWFPPKEWKSRYKVIPAEEDLVEILNYAVKNGEEVILFNGEEYRLTKEYQDTL